jgi:drug/metabolite transporter (DMT)-like permease
MPHPLQHWLYLLALVAIWGSAFMFTRIALQSFPPLTLVALRLGIGTLVLLVAAPMLKLKWHGISTTLLGYFLLMAIVGNSLPFFLISWGQQHVNSGIAGILMAIMPLATLFLAHFFLPDEPLSKRRLAGFVLGFAGILVLMGPQAWQDLQQQGIGWIAEFSIFCGALCYACGTIIARRRPESDDMVTTLAVLSLATLVMFPLSMGVQQPWLKPITPLTVLAMLFLGVVATGLATFLYFRLLRLAGATFLAQMNYLIPLWALAAGAIFLNEQVRWNAAVSLLLILGGIALAQSRFVVRD